MTIATISHQAVIRHQNQRRRYSRPVPAPTCKMILKLSWAVWSTKTIAEEQMNRMTVAIRPALT